MWGAIIKRVMGDREMTPKKDSGVGVLVGEVGEWLKTINMPQTNHTVEQLAVVAAKLIDRADVNPDYLDPTKCPAFERCVLTFGIAARWLDNPETFSAERRRLVLQIEAVWPSFLQGNKPQLGFREEGWGADTALTKPLVASYWPESMGDRRWLVDHKEELQANRQYDPYYDCFVFPANTREGTERVEELIAEGKIPAGLTMDFSGISSLGSGVSIVWRDTSDVGRLHEQMHARNKGLRLGRLGAALDEGATQWLAELGYWGEIENVLARGGSYRSSPYIDEMRLLRDLFHSVPGLLVPLFDHYNRRTVETAKIFLGGVIASFGVGAPLDLWRAFPLEYQRQLATPPKYWGVVDKSKFEIPRLPTAKEFKDRYGREPYGVYELEEMRREDHPPPRRRNNSPVLMRVEDVADGLGLKKLSLYSYPRESYDK